MHANIANIPQRSRSPTKNDEKDFRHDRSTFYHTGTRPGEYCIYPEWLSEEMHTVTPLGGRSYPPWPYEFHGARFWSRDIERETREKIREKPEMIQQQMFPPIGNCQSDKTTGIKLIKHRSPWRPVTFATRQSPSSSHDPANTKPYYNMTSRNHLNDGERELRNREEGITIGGLQVKPNHSEYFDHLHMLPGENTTIDCRGRSMCHGPERAPVASTAIMSQLNPLPRSFTSQDKPYLNMANPDWFKQPPTEY